MRAVFVPGHHPAIDAWISPNRWFISGVGYDLSAGRSLLLFGLKKTLHKAHVLEAVLRIPAITWSGSSGSVEAAPLLVPWVQRQVTWGYRSVDSRWSAEGGQDLVDIGPWNGTSRQLQTGDSVLELDVAEDVRKWASGAARNYGWMLRGSIKVGGATHPSLALRPSLFVRYSTTQVLAPAVDGGQ